MRTRERFVHVAHQTSQQRHESPVLLCRSKSEKRVVAPWMVRRESVLEMECLCLEMNMCLLSWSWSRLRCTDLGPTMAKIKRRSVVFSIVSMFVDRRKGHRSTRPLCTKAVWPRELDQMHLHSRYMFKSWLTRAVWCVYVHSFCPKKFGNEDIRQSMFWQNLHLISTYLSWHSIVVGFEGGMYMTVFALAADCCLVVNLQQPWIVAGKNEFRSIHVWFCCGSHSSCGHCCCFLCVFTMVFLVEACLRTVWGRSIGLDSWRIHWFVDLVVSSECCHHLGFICGRTRCMVCIFPAFKSKEDSILEFIRLKVSF